VRNTGPPRAQYTRYRTRELERRRERTAAPPHARSTTRVFRGRRTIDCAGRLRCTVYFFGFPLKVRGNEEKITFSNVEFSGGGAERCAATKPVCFARILGGTLVLGNGCLASCRWSQGATRGIKASASPSLAMCCFVFRFLTSLSFVVVLSHRAGRVSLSSSFPPPPRRSAPFASRCNHG
jgi:hypothetical protein